MVEVEHAVDPRAAPAVVGEQRARRVRRRARRRPRGRPAPGSAGGSGSGRRAARSRFRAAWLLRTLDGRDQARGCPRVGAAHSAPASAAGADRLPDAEIFAASTTDVITDPADPRLDVRLVGFRKQVAKIVRRGGGRPLGSQLLDGVFFSSILGFATFQRSREFDVDSVTRPQLQGDRRRAAPALSPAVGAHVRLPGPPLRSRRRRRARGPGSHAPSGCATASRPTSEARERLLGGSVTLDHRLILIASLPDLRLAKRFAGEIGGRVKHVTVRRWPPRSSST